jgi:hypothetical protein
VYTVKLTLDLKALGLPETVHAYNLEKKREELKQIAPASSNSPSNTTTSP